MKVSLAFEKKHQRRVLASRALSGAPPSPPEWADPGAKLLDECRGVVARCGPSPYLYAQKHRPEGAEVMGVVERALWPKATNVPASAPTYPEAKTRAALFRTFRPEVPSNLFVAAWAQTSPVAAVEAFAALHDFDVALVWSSRNAAHVALEEGSAGLATLRYAAGGAGEFPLVHPLREALGRAEQDAYDEALHAARAAFDRPTTAAPIRAGLAIAFPDEPAFATRALEELLATSPGEAESEQAKRQWLRWLLATPLAPGDALRVLDAIDDDVACPWGRGDSPVFTWLALEERAGRLEALASLLVERARKHLGGKGWATARSLGDGLAALRSDDVAQVFVDFAAHKAFEKTAPEALERHADLALPRLLAAAKGKGKHAKRAAELAAVLAQKRPELAGGEAQDKTGQGARKALGVAAAAELPAVLARPPWRRKPTPPPPPATEPAATLAHEEQIDFEHGELEAWRAQAEASGWLRGAEGPRYDGAPGTIAYSLSLEPTRQNLLAMRGLGAIDALVAHAEHRGNEGVEPLSRVDSPRIAPALAQVVADAGEPGRTDALVALARHPRAAAVGLVPRAASGDATARAGLSALVLVGAAAVVREVIDASGDAAKAALADLHALARGDVVPAKPPALPKFFLAEGFPPPVIVASGKALSPDAVAALGVLVRVSETLFPHPGLAEVRAACTPASLDAFAWALERAWEHAKAPDAHRFAALAIGHLGSARALRAFADVVAQWEKKKKVKLAASLLEAFAASPLPLGAVMLGRFASEAREPSLRTVAERWLARLQLVRATSREELTLAFDTLGFHDDALPIEDGVRAVVDDSLTASLRRGPSAFAPKGLSPDGAAAWTELKDALGDVKDAVIHRLELALSEQERFARAIFEASFVAHPLARRLASRVVFAGHDAAGALRAVFRPSAGGPPKLLDAGSNEVRLDGCATIGVIHPLDLDPALRDRLRAAIPDQPIEQLARETFPRPDAWPVVRGTVVPYRRLERLIDQRGFRLYRTHCGAPLHDWSYLQKSVDAGSTRISIGFNFGKHVGDAILGEILAQQEDGRPGIRRSAMPSPSVVSAIAMSEFARDLRFLAPAAPPG